MKRLLMIVPIAALLAAGLLATACSSNSSSALSESASPTPASQPGNAPAAVTIVAKNLKFDRDTVTLAANTQAAVTLDNQDNGVPHNFSVYDNEQLGQKILAGDIDTGPAKKVYTVPPLAAGTYYFRCDVHPDTMDGKLIVQ